MKVAEAIPAVRPEVTDTNHLRAGPTKAGECFVRPRPARPDEAGAPVGRREAREPGRRDLLPTGTRTPQQD